MGLCCVKRTNTKKRMGRKTTPESETNINSIGPSAPLQIINRENEKQIKLDEEGKQKTLVPILITTFTIGARIHRDDGNQEEYSMSREEINEEYKKCILMNNNSFTESVINFPYPGVIVRTEMSSLCLNSKSQNAESIQFMMGDEREPPKIFNVGAIEEQM